MKRFPTLLKAVCGKLFAGFVQKRLLAEFPEADELIQRRNEHQSDDPRMSGGLRVIG